jgi:hypothetical protein
MSSLYLGQGYTYRGRKISADIIWGKYEKGNETRGKFERTTMKAEK